MRSTKHAKLPAVKAKLVQPVAASAQPMKIKLPVVRFAWWTCCTLKNLIEKLEAVLAYYNVQLQHLHNAKPVKVEDVMAVIEKLHRALRR